jgi:hypothetical protein
MKISEMIENLKKFKDKHGDIECWYAVDDEGNDYKRVYFHPSLYYVNDSNKVYEYRIECSSSIENVTPICVVN